MKDGKIYSKYDFSGILKERRKACGYRSCSKLAEAMLPPKDEDKGKEAASLHEKKIGTLRKKLERWESGKGEPSISEFKQLCDLLECDPEYLWGTCPTPRRETKSVMDITGLSQNTVDNLIRRKNDLEILNNALKEDSDFLSRRDIVYEETALKGVDVLFRSSSFMKVLPFISKLDESTQTLKRKEKETLNLLYEFDLTHSSTESLSEENRYDLEAERESIWDEYRELSRDKQLVELRVSNGFTYTLRDISNGLSETPHSTDTCAIRASRRTLSKNE